MADLVFISDKALKTAVMLTDSIMRFPNIICTKLLFALREGNLCGRKLTSNFSLSLYEILGYVLAAKHSPCEIAVTI